MMRAMPGLEVLHIEGLLLPGEKAIRLVLYINKYGSSSTNTNINRVLYRWSHHLVGREA
jgi:hypothetical protein